MRRALSIALLTIVTWTLIAPFLSPGVEANLPPCCRRNGKHHCACAMAQRASDSAGFATVGEKCPCHPALACAVHSVMYKPVTAEAFRIALRRTKRESHAASRFIALNSSAQNKNAALLLLSSDHRSDLQLDV